MPAPSKPKSKPPVVVLRAEPVTVVIPPPRPETVHVVPTVVIDAGHGGTDGGTPAGGLLEKEWTLKVALSLAEELKKRGHLVELTRSADETLILTDRPLKVNAAPRTALISIHFNAGETDASGVETWYSWPKRPAVMAQLAEARGMPVSQLRDDGSGLAAAIQNAVHDSTGARDRGIKNRVDLAMTNRCLCPAVLVECGFLSNPEEGKQIQKNEYREKLVRGLANGYEAWILNRHSAMLTAGTAGGNTGSPVARPPLPSEGPGAGEKPEDAGTEH